LKLDFLEASFVFRTIIDSSWKSGLKE
jgi:hypothetical protein